MTYSIYAITNTKTGRVYVGRTKRPVAQRWYRHKWEFKKNPTTNPEMRADFLKLGEGCFQVTVLEEADTLESAVELEKKWINSFQHVYNCDLVTDAVGRKRKAMSEQHKAKIGSANRGKKRAPFSEEWRRRIGESNKGKVMSPEARAKISKTNLRNAELVRLAKTMLGEPCQDDAWRALTASLLLGNTT